MDTNRSYLKLCFASLALIASAGNAQTIYKQVDPEGRVMFTDRPSPEARVITSYETSRRSSRTDNDADDAYVPSSRRPMIEPTAAPMAAESERRVAPPETPRLAEPAATTIRISEAPGRPAYSFSSTMNLTESGTGSAASRQTALRSANDVERAIATYSPLTSSLAMEKDAVESARRARQELQKAAPAPAPVLVVKPVAREREPSQQHEGVTSFYLLWAGTFFLLAAGLLYVGWQTMRLILRGGFPRWQLGIG